MNRGAVYQNIFQDNKQRPFFLYLLSETNALFGVNVSAYCLMDNHYNWLINAAGREVNNEARKMNQILP